MSDPKLTDEEEAASPPAPAEPAAAAAADSSGDVPESGHVTPRTVTVQEGDTLRSLAVALDTTASQLARANRISTTQSPVFPGQVLHVPEPEPQPVPKKHVVKEEPEILDEEQFLKANVRHITDGRGVVFGSLLITPKTFMFQPNDTDLLVQENEPDQYQVIAPADLVVNLAVFRDFGQFNSKYGLVEEERKHLEETVPTARLVPLAHGEEEEEDVTSTADETAPTAKADTDTETAEETSKEDADPAPTDPLYLRLVMGKPLAKRLPRSAPIMSYGQQTLAPEYWFILPRAAAQRAALRFFSRLFPAKYGLLDHMSVERAGHEVIRPGLALLEEEAGRSANREGVSRVSAAMHKAPTLTGVDLEAISELIGESAIFTKEERRLLSRELPPGVDGHNWLLSFATTTDGFNLNSLYRKLADHAGPVILFVEDTAGHAFGAYLTRPPAISEHFVGTGESFVFALRPHGLKVWRWTGENEYFFRGGHADMIVGLDNGRYAIWLDGDLNRGRTQACCTFDNEPLSSGEDFTLKTLECWAFVM